MASLDAPVPTLPGVPPTTGRSRRPGHATIRNRHVALRINVRVLTLTLVALAALAVISIWAMTLGSFPIPFMEVAKAVVGQGSDDQLFVVRTLRLPRVICAILIGMCLAMAGAIFQGLARNPLVSPDIIGIDAGATVVAMVWIISGRPYSLLPVGAFIGAVLTAAIIYGLSWKRGISTSRLILVGIGIGEVIGAFSTFVTLKYPIEVVRPAIVWTMGSIYGSNWRDVQILLGCLIVVTPIAVGLMWKLRALQLGNDAARSLGMSLEGVQAGLIITGCALAASAVAIAGPIGFVALMIPHIARMLAGPMSGSVLLFTASLGAIFLLLSDIVGQHYLPVTLPVGVVTAAVGAPYFLYLMYRSAKLNM